MARRATTGHENDRTAAILTSKALLAYYAEDGRTRGIILILIGLTLILWAEAA